MLIGSGVVEVCCSAWYGRELLRAGAGALAALAVMCVLLQKKKEMIAVRKAGWLVPGLLFGGLLSIASSYVMRWFGVYDHASNVAQEALFAAPLWLQLLALGLVVPAAEELAYRGVFYRRLKRVLPVWASIIVCSMTFALGHGNLIQILYAMPMGLILCLTAEFTDDLVLPLAVHAGANLASVIVNWLL